MENSLTNSPTKASHNNSSNSMIMLKLNNNKYENYGNLVKSDAMYTSSNSKDVKKPPKIKSRKSSINDVPEFIISLVPKDK